MSDEKTFLDLGLKKPVLRGVERAGFTTPSPIQAQAIPAILKGGDLIAQAQTGTGKTAAFVLPILHSLHNSGEIEALIITPTRELAMQISDEAFKLGKFCNTRTICVYGGQNIKHQISFLDKNPQIMIATPGRLLDHLKNNRLRRFAPRIVVLDESDEMLDMGFLDDIEEIFSYLPEDIQVLLFSATMPKPIKELADKILLNPTSIKITPTEVANTDIAQRYYVINESERNEAIIRLLDTQNPSCSIIFTRTKKEADTLNNFLCAQGHESVALHGDLDQRARRDAITSFKNKQVRILVATDVASRGLDISNVSHVFNYHIPLNPESYIHRIGRTGRAGKKGVAITLVSPLEYKELQRIQDDIGSKLELFEMPFDPAQKLQKILDIKISDEAIDAYSQLSDQTEPTQLCLKLLTHYLDGNKIGASMPSLEQIAAESKKESASKHRSRSHSKSSGHGGQTGHGAQGGGNRRNSSNKSSHKGYDNKNKERNR
ncbi:DEAD/DEAH box helicase [Helicobacter sp. CLO-3]|uniref:DEAD/DEAH box helicase n=1 Tax=unclassified Helicobacter TaxID=2593540 RepID=UPI000805F87C|nr:MULTISPECIES: DEAD/DEAH box helicase [unclassified Helicobacter]OBV29282.1 DEAD/DEAH box helicase [Helicobacter sp. CLO-3]OHU82947.1 DEAD/DEAH box helicase [Helicobacter sp. CLO-3]